MYICTKVNCSFHSLLIFRKGCINLWPFLFVSNICLLLAVNNIKKMETPKEYHFETIDQILNVANESNVETLLIDFATFLSTYVALIEKTKKEYPEETEGLTNLQIIGSKFIWVDDGKNEVLSTTIENPQTGERTTIKH